jgi:hypothetical protein
LIAADLQIQSSALMQIKSVVLFQIFFSNRRRNNTMPPQLELKDLMLL